MGHSNGLGPYGAGVVIRREIGPYNAIGTQGHADLYQGPVASFVRAQPILWSPDVAAIHNMGKINIDTCIYFEKDEALLCHTIQFFLNQPLSPVKFLAL